MDKKALKTLISEESTGSPTQPKTFWIKRTAIDKIKTLQENSDSSDVIAEIKKAIERTVEELWAERPAK